MSLGWLGFGQESAKQRLAGGDTGVAPARTWVLTGLIFVSTAALLGTSDDTPQVMYTFVRTELEGRRVELTVEQPVARFTVKLRAEDLGPDGVLTTENAVARVHGAVKAESVEGDGASAFVGVRLSDGADAGSNLQVVTRFDLSHDFVFEGNCEQPTEGTPCTAELQVELSRLDEGANGGTVAVEWALDLSSRTSVFGEGDDVTQEPPWSVELTGP